jgi:hypothetical protein
MTDKIEIINEQFGNFMMAPTLPPPPISAPPTTPVYNNPSLNELMKSNEQYVIDNALLYKKLVDIENEIKSLKNMVNNLHYPRHTYYPVQPFTFTTQPPLATPPNPYAPLKPNQTHFF